MSQPLSVGDTSRNGRYRIIDKVWDHNGTMFVTVGLTTSQPVSGRDIEAMRRLARRAVAMPHLTKSSRVVDRRYHDGVVRVRFAVSRLEP